MIDCKHCSEKAQKKYVNSWYFTCKNGHVTHIDNQ